MTVIIPCFNYGRYVADAVDSVLNQTFQDYEIIVVDGGSDDSDSRQALSQLKRPKTQVYWREGRRLVGDNRNFGIERANGKYVCCLDADDMIKPTYLEKALYLLETQGFDVVSTSYQFFGDETGVFKIAERPTLAQMLEGNHVATCALFKRSLWRRSGGFQDKGTGSDYVYEDWRLWIRFAALGARIANIAEEPLFLYRVHAGSLTDNPVVRPAKVHREEIVALESQVLNESAFKLSERRQQEYLKVDNPLVNLLSRADSDPRPTLLVAFPFLSVGGAERLFSAILNYLSKQGYRVVIVTHLDNDASHGDASEWFAGASSEVYHLRRFLDEAEWRQFVQYLIVSRQVKLIWVVGSQFMYDMLREICSDRPAMKVIDSLFNTVGHTRNNRDNRDCIDLNVVESSEVERWLRERGESAERIRLIPSGVNLDRFRPGPKPGAILDGLGIDPGDFVVGYSGRLSEEKRPEIFLQIAKRLAHRSDIQFVMTGAGPLTSNVKRRIKQMRLGASVHFVGNVEDVRDYLRLYDTLVLPSRLDGRPVVVLESLAMGLPVVASRIGGLPELIQHGQTGYLCDPADLGAFVSHIEWLADHREDHSKMRTAARAFAEAQLGDEKMNERYAGAVRELLGLPSDPIELQFDAGYLPDQHSSLVADP